MTDNIADLLLFAGGMLTMGFAMLPLYFRSWSEGYEDAKKTYNNWDLGFTQGFRAGIVATLEELQKEDNHGLYQ